MMSYTLQQFLIKYVKSFKIYRGGKIWKEILNSLLCLWECDIILINKTLIYAAAVFVST